jgi:hypothetical protein
LVLPAMLPSGPCKTYSQPAAPPVFLRLTAVPAHLPAFLRRILVIGGAGIVLGLATYGYKIMRVLGVKMVKLTNSRGFVVEMSAATIVILGGWVPEGLWAVLCCHDTLHCTVVFC